MRPKKNLLQNTVCLEQEICASQENFTQPLVVLVETFRRSAYMTRCLRMSPLGPTFLLDRDGDLIQRGSSLIGAFYNGPKIKCKPTSGTG